ncbi:Hypothetical protein PHPALM_13162 [Phytophthora palmivora]|uniref:Uncharacterized protein n=1 Tax=Phytophthora palmivora TaxID=4796 RepID=A0A2P4XXW1_9STRA|nr:Hypothetical protein PHPALM_13162 [Phytophthora palmivora]
MVRAPGSVGDSGFHRESQEDVPTGTPTDLDVSRDPSTKQGKVKAEPYRLVGSPVEPSPYPPRDLPVSRSDKRKPKKKLTRKKMKAPEIDDGDQIGSKPRSRSEQGWSDEDLENLFYHKELREFLDRNPVMRILRLKQVGDPREPVSAPIKTANKLEAVKDLLRLLKEAGMTTGAFDADDVFDLDLKVIQTATKDLFSKLKILVGEIPQIQCHHLRQVLRIAKRPHHTTPRPPKMNQTSRRNQSECLWDRPALQCWRRDPRSNIGISQDPAAQGQYRPPTTRSQQPQRPTPHQAPCRNISKRP